LLLDDLRRHPGVAAAVAATFALGAVLFGAYRLLGAPAAMSMPAPAPRPRAVVLAYLRDDLAEPAARALERTLGGLPGVVEVKRVAPAEALGRMRQQLGAHARVLDGAEDGLLSPSIEVSLIGDAGGEGDLGMRAAELARRLRPIEGVSDVDVVAPAAGFSTDASTHVASGQIRRPGPMLWLALLALGAAAATAALAGVLALRRARRRAEIALMLALGFTRASAFFPAVSSVVVAALVGAALGLAALRVGWGLSPRDCALALAAALGAGALAGYLTVRVPDPADAR
jgi:cell division protein FtsX